MKKTLPLAVLAAALASSPAFAGILPATPNSMIVPPSPPMTEEVARTLRTLVVPVKVVHITVRHNGDRVIRLVAHGTIEAQDGAPSEWSGETVQEVLHARLGVPSPQGDRYTVSTNEVQAGETVTVIWDSLAHSAQVNVRTHGMGQPKRLDTMVATVPSEQDASVDRLAPDGLVIVGLQQSPSQPASDRREIDAFFVGGPAGTDVDEVKVWNAVRHAYDVINADGEKAPSTNR